MKKKEIHEIGVKLHFDKIRKPEVIWKIDRTRTNSFFSRSRGLSL